MLRRTSIPVWYTEGYNPRVYMVFSLSLPLSVEGEKEYLDLRLTDDAYTDDDVLSELSRESACGIEITSVSTPVHGIGDIAFARYTAEYREADGEKLLKHITSVISSGTLTALKVTKKGSAEINLAEHVRNFSAAADGGALSMTFILPAGSVFNINPLLFAEALFKDSGVDFHNVLIKRAELLTEDMNEYC